MHHLHTTSLFGVVLAVLGCASAQDSPNFMGIFKTTSFVALEWKVEDPNFSVYTTPDILVIENAATQYYTELLSQRSLSAFQLPNKFIDASISMRTQVRSGDNMILEASVNVYHVGDSGITDLSDLLRFVTNKNTTGSDDFEVLDSLIGMGVKVDMVSFANAQESKALAGGFPAFYADSEAADDGNRYTESERTLIVVTSVLSFALFALSAILIWVAGGWLGLRKQVLALIHREEELTRMTINNKTTLEQKPTQDTDDEENSPRHNDDENGTQFTNPSGILGVNPYYGKPSTKTFEELGVKMTPARPKRSDDLDSSTVGLETPMSVYSDSGRAPIGIQSMRKLLASRNDSDGLMGDPYGMRLDFNE